MANVRKVRNVRNGRHDLQSAGDSLQRQRDVAGDVAGDFSEVTSLVN